MLLEALQSAPPELAFAALTVGVLLVYVELNRPGRVVPGCAGLLLALLAVSRLVHLEARPAAWIAVLAAFALWARQTRRKPSLGADLAATVLLTLGFSTLLPAPPPSQRAIAAVCALLLAAVTAKLSRLARRARAAKGLD